MTVSGMSPEGLELLKQWEGFRPYSYDDATDKRLAPGEIPKGTCTGGYGHTGPDVVAGMDINEAQALAWLKKDVADACSVLNEAVPIDLRPGQSDALISFIFNIGPGRPKGTNGPDDPGHDGFMYLRSGKPSKLLTYVSDPECHPLVPAELQKWNKAGGVENEGLANRRAAEAGLWAKGSFVASNTVPAEASRPPPPHKDTAIQVVSATAAVSFLVAAKQVADAMKDLVDPLTGNFGTYGSAICSVLVVCGVAFWAYRIYHRRQDEKP